MRTVTTKTCLLASDLQVIETIENGESRFDIQGRGAFGNWQDLRDTHTVADLARLRDAIGDVLGGRTPEKPRGRWARFCAWLGGLS